LFLLNQNAEVCKIFLMGRLVNSSFMSNDINLLLLWSWMLCKYCATSCEFLVMKVLGRLTRFSNFLFNYLAVLYAGACRLFITGRIDAPSLCVFMYAFILDALGFIFIRYFILSISISKLHVWRTCCVRLWKVSVGSFLTALYGSLVRSYLFSAPEHLFVLWPQLYFCLLWLLLDCFYVRCL